MTQTKSDEHTEQKLPRRDWILLPLLGLVTIGVIAGVVWSFAGWMFGQSAEGVAKCMQTTDPALGVYGRPNAVCWDKGHETALIEYRLNSCGYRMDVECGPPQPGTYRIVMIGSSLAMGQWISRQRSLAALLPAELSLRTGRKIEVYNEGMMWEYPQVLKLRLTDVLIAKPDLVLWILSSAEVGYVTADPATLKPAARPIKAALLVRAWRRLNEALATGTIAAAAREASRRAQEKFVGSSTGVMLLHYLYQSQTRYVNSYLRGTDLNVGFLRTEPSLSWSNNLKQFDKDTASIEQQAMAAGIPLAVVLVPSRAAAAMISMGQWPSGFDPYKLGEEVRPIVESHGGRYINIMSDFRAIPNPEKYYFPVDGHPDSGGHALLSKLVAKGLTSGPVPMLPAAAQQLGFEHKE